MSDTGDDPCGVCGVFVAIDGHEVQCQYTMAEPNYRPSAVALSGTLVWLPQEGAVRPYRVLEWARIAVYCAVDVGWGADSEGKRDSGGLMGEGKRGRAARVGSYMSPASQSPNPMIFSCLGLRFHLSTMRVRAPRRRKPGRSRTKLKACTNGIGNGSE